jgi:hypothetical protein
MDSIAMSSQNGSGKQAGAHEPLDPDAFHPATLSLHADDFLNTANDVSPAIHISTTYRYTRNLEELRPIQEEDVSAIAEWL